MPIDQKDAYKLDNIPGKVFKDTALGSNLLELTNALQFFAEAFAGYAARSGLKTRKALYQQGVDGGAVGTINLKDGNGDEIVIPSSAVIKEVIIVENSPITGGGGSTIALGVNTTTDILGATAIASITSLTATAIDGTFANYIEVSGDSPLQLTIGTNALTGGAIYVYVTYFDPTT